PPSFNYTQLWCPLKASYLTTIESSLQNLSAWLVFENKSFAKDLFCVIVSAELHCLPNEAVQKKRKKEI
ncbi:MAG: hypothetical protein WCJ49_03765, partial [Deltaproteobacteria bacterium]